MSDNMHLKKGNLSNPQVEGIHFIYSGNYHYLTKLFKLLITTSYLKYSI